MTEIIECGANSVLEDGSLCVWEGRPNCQVMFRGKVKSCQKEIDVGTGFPILVPLL